MTCAQDTRPTLCPVIEGVLFSFERDGQPCRGLVLGDALETIFGLREGGPERWVELYERHCDEIVGVARRLRPQPGDVVVVRGEDLLPGASCRRPGPALPTRSR